ncbi:polysaccharide deacetylase family protein [Longimicrobium sp.]|uniref:polysaccharide deacetylase family protein n=1 Tax=Longimicrobium sp. TaxID=2029185 RepID=UPI003B39FA91
MKYFRSHAFVLIPLLALAGCALAGPSATRPTGGAAGGVPVLAWHGFADSAGTRPGSLTESYAAFEEMIVFLRENGFRSAFPEEVRAGADASARQVILTFDDGTAGQMRAAEILERHGFRGIFFVIPTRTGSNDGFLGADDLERLARAGHRVAAHGWQHRSLPGSGTEVAASLARSPTTLGERAQPTAKYDFAFPFGHYTDYIAEALAGGYRYLHTVNPGYWDGRSPLLPRMLIMAGVKPALFREYVLAGRHYRPTLEPLTPDGAVAGRIAFRAHGPVPDGLELFAITADASGRSYVSNPLGDLARVAGDTVWVDLAGYMARHYPPGRAVISYALVTRENGEMRYASPGLLNWTGDPIEAFRPAPPPARPDSAAAPGTD